MNRAEFRWALDAVIPHAHKNGFLALHAKADSKWLYAWATDRYSAGIAQVQIDPMPNGLSVHLPTKEAKELVRFIKPEYAAERQEPVELLAHFEGERRELHVGIAQDSAVFDCVEYPEGHTFEELMLPRIKAIWDAPYLSDEWTFNPEIFARFSRAKRLDSDRLVMHPRHIQGGAKLAVVTVGEDFLGVAAGMTDGESPRLTLLEGE